MANQSIKDAFQRFWEYVTARIDDQKTVVVNVTEGASGKFTADMTYEQICEKMANNELSKVKESFFLCSAKKTATKIPPISKSKWVRSSKRVVLP